MEHCKKCAKCGETKAISEFHKDAQMRDGHRNQCRSCVSALSAKYRKSETGRAVRVARDQSEARKAARARYEKSELVRTKNLLRWTLYKRLNPVNPEMVKARNAVNNAITAGKLVRWPVCAVPECSGKPQAHHPDYSRPLDVVWLCAVHHRQVHALAA